MHNPQADEWQRIRALMEQYQDTTMDLADASLFSLAELGGLKHIFTLDDDFYIYSANGKETCELICWIQAESFQDSTAGSTLEKNDF